MSLTTKVSALLDIALRVPPLFLLDAVLNYGHETTKYSVEKFMEFTFTDWNANNVTKSSLLNEWLSPSTVEIGVDFLSFLINIQVFFLAVFVCLFSTKQLAYIYIRMAAIAIIAFTYETNTSYVNMFINKNQEGKIPLLLEKSNHTTLLILTFLFSFTNALNLITVWLVFFTPILACSSSLPITIIKLTPTFSVAGSAVLLVYSVWLHGFKVCDLFYRGIMWCHGALGNYGLYSMIETHWTNLHVTQVFRVFWIIRMARFLYTSGSLEPLPLSDTIKSFIINGSENTIAVLGMASTLSLACEIFGYIIYLLLRVHDPIEKELGNLCSLLFLTLNLQVGVTEIDPEKRYIQISRNIILIITALMHFAYYIGNPILLSLGASNNPSTLKHIKALIVISIPIFIPILIIYHQWSTETQSSWLTTMTSFMAELVIKGSISVLIYLLFIIDTYKNGLWENLDDYIFYLKFSVTSAEFILGIYLLFNSMWIFTFETTSMIRACMMGLHIYFNIWIPATNGWNSYQTRDSALRKINFLPVATKEQLKCRKDVCAICFQALTTARITSCNHYFHGICLRKWLNVQDTCPLCHKILYDLRHIR
ncbi:protein TRC8 homolog [Trichonephila clavata]|uniref:Protein TRC8 homolog n=1 Tax=Trichonephila clavata TaxID=2740835 RepID=A0A8X6JTB7_TRICU|nr:protein TRC8 homolog [Trichonephila clavata]